MMEIKNYSRDSLKIIEQSDFLKVEDWNALVEMKAELQETFEKKQLWRTETEMRVSVLNDLKYPTNASKYWQSVREKAVFFENLVALSFDYRRNNVEIRKVQKKLKIETDIDENELLQIDLEEKLFTKKNMELASRDRVRELKLWSKIKGEVNNNSFDTNDVNNHQLVSYTQRFINQKLASGNNGSPAERQNLDGQLQQSLKECVKHKVLNTVLAPYNKTIVELIKNEIKLLDKIDVK